MDYWQKQTKDKPLFPDILWSRPENRRSAGKLLVIGGNDHSFAAVAKGYEAALSSGAGVVHAVLPDSLRKQIKFLWDGVDYAASTPSGSLAQKALHDLLDHAHWADMVLLAGDVGRNSETAALLEQFVQKYQGPLVVTKDVIDYFYAQPELLINREDTCLVLSLAQLQKLATALKFQTPFLLSMGMVLLVQALHSFTQAYPVTVVVKELDSIVVAHQGKVSSTKLIQDKEIWRVATAAQSATFWMQNPARAFESITSSLIA